MPCNISFATKRELISCKQARINKFARFGTHFKNPSELGKEKRCGMYTEDEINAWNTFSTNPIFVYWNTLVCWLLFHFLAEANALLFFEKKQNVKRWFDWNSCRLQENVFKKQRQSERQKTYKRTRKLVLHCRSNVFKHSKRLFSGSGLVNVSKSLVGLFQTSSFAEHGLTEKVEATKYNALDQMFFSRSYHRRHVRKWKWQKN